MQVLFRGTTDAVPFESKVVIGGGRGLVTDDTVYNNSSNRGYARKRFRRCRRESSEAIYHFTKEIQVLKKIKHHHCVELVSSSSFLTGARRLTVV